jgi:hypothetical protein
MLSLGIFIFAISMIRLVSPIQAQDTLFPQVASMQPAAPSAHSTTHTTFAVTFTQAVIGVDINDFTVATDLPGVAIVATTSAPNTNTYLVTVAHGDYNGQLLLILVDDDSIVNAEGIPLGDHGTQNGNAVSVTRTVSSALTAHLLAATPRVGGVNVGTESDIALTNSKKSKNIPVIAYYDTTNQTLKLAVCNNMTCTNPTVQTIGGAVSVHSLNWGRSPSIVLANGEIPVISYYDVTNGDLWLTICKDALCNKFTSKVIDGTTTDAGELNAIALTSTGVPIISYSNATDNNQMLATCSSTACTTVTITSINQTNFGSWNDMKLSSKGFPVLAYYDTINGYLVVTTCQNITCTSKDQTTLSGEFFTNPSLALTKDDIPVVSYYDNNLNKLQLMRCQNTTCVSGFVRTTVVADCNCVPTLALDSNDIPVIGYSKYDGTNYSLHVTRCDALSCSSPTTTAFEMYSPSFGAYPDITITDNDVPILSSYDVTNGKLMLHFDLPALDNGTPRRFTKSPVTTSALGAIANATFTWLAAPGATSYEYCVSPSPADCAPLSSSWVAVGNSTSASVTSLSRVTTYYWQVRAVNAAGSTLATGGIQSFVTK